MVENTLYRRHCIAYRSKRYVHAEVVIISFDSIITYGDRVWLIVTVLKTVERDERSVGSNPTPSARNLVTVLQWIIVI